MTHKEQIQKSLGITTDEYTQAVEEAGYQWIARYFGNDADTSHLISTCRMFWLWWVNEWEIRDAEYIRVTSIDLLDAPLDGRYWQAAFKEWLEVHAVKNLTLRPNRWVRVEISKTIKEKTETIKK